MFFLSLLLFSSTFSHLCEKVLDIVSKWLALFSSTIYLNFNCTRLKNIYHFPVAANTRAHAWHKSHEICYYVANFVSCNCSGNCASVLIVLVQLSLRSTVKAAAKGIPLEFIFFFRFFCQRCQSTLLCASLSHGKKFLVFRHGQRKMIRRFRFVSRPHAYSLMASNLIMHTFLDRSWKKRLLWSMNYLNFQNTLGSCLRILSQNQNI